MIWLISSKKMAGPGLMVAIHWENPSFRSYGMCCGTLTDIMLHLKLALFQFQWYSSSSLDATLLSSASIGKGKSMSSHKLDATAEVVCRTSDH